MNYFILLLLLLLLLVKIYSHQEKGVENYKSELTEQNRTEQNFKIILRPRAGGIREHAVIYLTAAI